MEREIKFRAWDGDLKNMFQDVAWVPRRMSATKNWVFMQFTGLIDKNGKAIYEGDIVRNISDPKFTSRIEYLNGQWIRHINEYELRNQLIRFCGGFYSDVMDRFEVIGNIYENSELINPV